MSRRRPHALKPDKMANSMTSPLAGCWERGFRALLWRFRPDHLQSAVAEASSHVANEVDAGLGLDSARELVYQRMRRQIIERLLVRRFGPVEPRWSLSWRRRQEQLASLLERAIPATALGDSPDFHCDAALGGLAHWLRATGYDARFWPGIDDQELVRTVLGTTSILLTTDSRLMRHGAIAHGVVAALLVPVTLDKYGQSEFVTKTLELPPKPTRCMACGGDLEPVDKESVRQRVPPRTFPWRDEYFICRRCNRLYWEGTHWQRIRDQLSRLASALR